MGANTVAIGPSRAWLTIHRHPDGTNLIASVFKQVVQGHGAMQRLGGMLIHRDIKPRNILLLPVSKREKARGMDEDAHRQSVGPSSGVSPDGAMSRPAKDPSSRQ